MNLEQIDCKECDGSGSVSGGRYSPDYRCPDCSGTGIAWLLDGMPLDNQAQIVTDGRGGFWERHEARDMVDDEGELEDGTPVYAVRLEDMAVSRAWWVR